MIKKQQVLTLLGLIEAAPKNGLFDSLFSCIKMLTNQQRPLFVRIQLSVDLNTDLNLNQCLNGFFLPEELIIQTL